VVKDGTATFGTRPSEGPVGIHPDAFLGGRHREAERRQDGQGLVQAFEAAQRGAGTDAPRVEADQVRQ
jgi:hypothetical protein